MTDPKINLAQLRKEIDSMFGEWAYDDHREHPLWWDLLALIDTAEAATELTANWKHPPQNYLPTERRLRETLDRFER